MAIDHISVIEREAARVLDAYRANPGGKVPWSERWSVNSVARHVAGAHHAVAQIIEDRPTTDFGRSAGLDMPAKGDPGFPAWSSAGTDALVTQCRDTPAAEVCWTPHPDGGGTGRLDAERAGVDVDGDLDVLARWTELVPPG